MDASMLATYRSNKDQFLISDANSPLPLEYRDSFTGLPYFEWDRDLVFTVPVQESAGEVLPVAASDGAERIYRRAAVITFAIRGSEQSLALFDTGHPGLFLPFRDATSGRETYGGGRYLDLEPAPNGTVTVDFNLAYSPFCAYNDRYSCALPPAENWMSVPIEAGEKTWRKPS
jgi:hypothetical protein